jgi:DNA primase catalytic core
LCPFHDDKNPSLHVTSGKRLWRCVSCQATGNMIQFVQKFDGVSFRHACELLKNRAALANAPSCAPVKKTTVPKLPAPVAADIDDHAALRQVLDYYHERLKENPPALAYLKKRGLTAEAVAAFRVGFVDRTLGLRLPQRNRAEGAALRACLARLGVLRDTGREHLCGRVVFPVVGESGEIGTVYGRAIDDGGKHDRHLFLAGPMRGVWNPAALRAPEVILCEGIIDALTFWGAGYRNVTTCYSAKALPGELLGAIVAAKVRRVLVAFDRDDAGEPGAAEVAAQLSEYGIEATHVLFPHGQDANAYALAVTPPEKSLGLRLRAALPLGEVARKAAKAEVSASPSLDAPPAPASSSLAAKAALADAPARVETTASAVPPTEPEKAAREETLPSGAASSGVPVTVAKNDSEEIVLSVGDREWCVRGLAKNAGFESLKVTLRLTCAERWHLDNLDLCVARQRAVFVEAAATETVLRPELVMRDLGHVLRKLEELQEERLKAQAEPKTADAPSLTAQEREAALGLLRAPDLLDRILADFAACGVVGEETNKLVGYLAAVSRKLENPLAVIVQSTSAAGKSALMEAVLAFGPPEEGVEKASYALKLLQSEGGTVPRLDGEEPVHRPHGDAGIPRRGAGDDLPDHDRRGHRRGAFEQMPGAGGGRVEGADAAHPRAAARALHARRHPRGRVARGRAGAAPRGATALAAAAGFKSLRRRLDLPGRQDAHAARPHEVSAADRDGGGAAPAPAGNPRDRLRRRPSGRVRRCDARRHRGGEPPGA